MGGEFTYQPKWDPISFDNDSQLVAWVLGTWESVCACQGTQTSAELGPNVAYTFLRMLVVPKEMSNLFGLTIDK